MAKTKLVSIGDSGKSVTFPLAVLIIVFALLVIAFLFRSTSPAAAATLQQTNLVQWEYLLIRA
jgi:hypothetical protein